MKRNLLIAFSAAAFAMAASTAFAQSSNMSSGDIAMMNECKGMSESAMKKNKECMTMMKKHPDMMKGSSGMSGGMSK